MLNNTKIMFDFKVCILHVIVLIDSSPLFSYGKMITNQIHVVFYFV